MIARLKTIVLSAFCAMSVFTAVTVSSCNDDKCRAIVCAHGGVCTDGACLCQPGYEGATCTIVNRDRFLGTWNVTENGSITDQAAYSINIEEGDNITEVEIKNFRNLLVTNVKAYVKGDTLYIPQQNIDNHTIVGSGVLNFEEPYGEFGQLVVKYKVTDANNNVDDFGVDGGDASLWNK